MSKFFAGGISGDKPVKAQLISFELYQTQDRPVVMVEIDGLPIEVPIMGYGHLEDNEGNQSIVPLIMDHKGCLTIVCECCHKILEFLPPFWEPVSSDENETEVNEAAK